MSQQDIVIPSRYGALIGTLEGLRDFHAMGVLLGGFLLVALVFGLGAASGRPALMALLAFVAVVLAACVVHATGVSLMDKARSQPRRNFVALLLAGAMCFLKFIGIAIIAAAGVTLYALVLALLLYICKIPFLGPPLLVVLLPVMILATSALMVALFVGFSLAAPVLWEGNSVTGALSRLFSVTRLRSLEVLISLILLSLLTGVVLVIVSGFVLSGTAEVGGLATAIFGDKLVGGMASFMGAMGGGYGAMGYGGAAGGAGEGLAIAGLIGLMLVGALVWGAIIAVQINGLCRIYLQASAGTDDALAMDNLGKSLSHAKEKFFRSGEKIAGAARGLSTKARLMFKPSGTAAKPAGPPPAVAARTCPSCQADVGAHDRFCGACGAKLDSVSV